MKIADSIAEQVRFAYSQGERMIYLIVNGREALFLARKYSAEWINNASDADIRRVLVY